MTKGWDTPTPRNVGEMRATLERLFRLPKGSLGGYVLLLGINDKMAVVSDVPAAAGTEQYELQVTERLRQAVHAFSCPDTSATYGAQALQDMRQPGGSGG